MRRLFISIPIPEEINSALVEYLSPYKKEPIFNDTRWTRTENLHITLVFLGDVREKEIPELAAILKGICAQTRPFELSLQSITTAPPKKKPRMIWANFAKHPEFTDLTNKMKRFLSPFQNERPEHDSKDPIPHLTLARFKPNPRLSRRKFRPLDLPDLVIKECDLMESELSESGSNYTILETFKFAE